MAINVVASLSKGQRVLITGNLRVRDWESGDRAGTTVEVDADAIGHDLSYGSSVFTRAVAAVSEPADDDIAAVTGPVAVEVDGTIVAITEHITPA